MQRQPEPSGLRPKLESRPFLVQLSDSERSKAPVTESAGRVTPRRRTRFTPMTAPCRKAAREVKISFAMPALVIKSSRPLRRRCGHVQKRPRRAAVDAGKSSSAGLASSAVACQLGCRASCKEKLPAKVNLWHVAEINDKCAPSMHCVGAEIQAL